MTKQIKRYVLILMSLVCSLGMFHGITAEASIKVKPELRNLSASYHSETKTITIKGKTTDVHKVQVLYNNKKVKKVKTDKKGNFVARVKFKGYQDFKLYGLDQKGKKATGIYRITSEQYASDPVEVRKITRSKKGITYYLDTRVPAIVNFYYKGEKVYSEVIDSTGQKIWIKDSILKGKKGYFTVKQMESNKKASKAVKVKIIGKGQTLEVNK